MSADVAHLDELDRIAVGKDGLMWRPVRRKLGIESLGVNAWTENDPARMNALIDAGVTGIFTDYPNRLRTVLEARK